MYDGIPEFGTNATGLSGHEVNASEIIRFAYEYRQSTIDINKDILLRPKKVFFLSNV
jgi:hypothetical protein